MRTFGLLGEKLEHSYSPMIHGLLGDYLYLLFEISPDDLDTFMKSKQFDGINVTIPYKQTVMPYCDILSDEAKAVGSVNTIIKDSSGVMHGHNTDYFGFHMMLERGRIDPGGKKALVLGDGGSARTVRAVLADLGSREIVTISRRSEENYGNIKRHYDAEIIVNTTPVGMFPNNGGSLLSVSRFTRLSGVADLIYNPARTKLILEAEDAGVPCVSGLSMLVAQAEKARRLFLDAPEKPGVIDAIYNEVAKKTQNIALIGMPGCGKSTVGTAVAKDLGRAFIDIDEIIEATAGKTIPEIFETDGEESFRHLETQVLAVEAARTGTVIATGGGVVTRSENYDLLCQNSIIVYMKRSLSDLTTVGRPLSMRVGVDELAEKRLPVYEAWSDFAIEVDNDLECTVARILEVVR